MAMGHTIQMTEIHAWVTVVVLLVLTIDLAVIKPTMANDPDPLQDFCIAKSELKASDPTINGAVCKPIAEVTASDFVSVVLKTAGNTNNPEKVSVTPANIDTFRAVNTQGISMVRIDWAKGGINPPHVHPRASEILFLVEGSLYVGFISSVNNKLFATYLQKGELFIFPRGLIHFQLNVGKGNAFAISALNSQNFGVSQVAAALFTPTNIDDQVLTKGFRTTQEVVDTIQKGFHTK